MSLCGFDASSAGEFKHVGVVENGFDEFIQAFCDCSRCVKTKGRRLALDVMSNSMDLLPMLKIQGFRFAFCKEVAKFLCVLFYYLLVVDPRLAGDQFIIVRSDRGDTVRKTAPPGIVVLSVSAASVWADIIFGDDKWARGCLGPLKLCQSEVRFGGFRDGTEALLGRGYSASIA